MFDRYFRVGQVRCHQEDDLDDDLKKVREQVWISMERNSIS